MALTYVDMASVIEVQVTTSHLFNLKTWKNFCRGFIRKFSKSFLFQRSVWRVTAAASGCRVEVQRTPGTQPAVAGGPVDCHRVNTVGCSDRWNFVWFVNFLLMQVMGRACINLLTFSRRTSHLRSIIRRHIKVRHSSNSKWDENLSFKVAFLTNFSFSRTTTVSIIWAPRPTRTDKLRSRLVSTITHPRSIITTIS